MDNGSSFMTLRTRRPNNDGSSLSSADSTYGSADGCTPATHDISRVSYHVKHLENFVQTLQDSANRAFPNRGRSLQRYSNVQALLLHWKCDDLFVLPELEDLEKTLREDYNFETDIFPIPSENAHLELMLKIGDLIKKHESEDTLFVIYYGGHAKIDESRQSTWCATRHPASPWLQWSAIQTLLERSASDVLILLDCCAGAASATFPNCHSITETISASSWDAIAPDPGRYSFTNALIEVLQEWRNRTFSAAMIHAEVLARLKHPRPILINGKHFEARSTPVHFMMTSNHRAPSIELGRIVPDSRRPATPPKELTYHPAHLEPTLALAGRSTVAEPAPFHNAIVPEVTDPNESHPHVMISLALEDDQRLDLNAWEQWLANFPSLAKHVKVQGVFKSHSTLLLLSLPVMVWDLLPDDPAYSFVAFIRSNNLIREQSSTRDSAAVPVPVRDPAPVRPRDIRVEPTFRDGDSVMTSLTGTTFIPADDNSSMGRDQSSFQQSGALLSPRPGTSAAHSAYARPAPIPPAKSSPGFARSSALRSVVSAVNLAGLHRQQTAPPSLPGVPGLSGGDEPTLSEAISRTMILNQSRSSKRVVYSPSQTIPEGPALAGHVVKRLEEYYQREREPNMAITEFLASNLGVETDDIRLWFHHRREQEKMTYNLQNLKIDDHAPEAKAGARMILAGQLNNLLGIFPPKSVLIVDLRSSIDYEKSHIHDAIHLRAPVSFVEAATLEMIEDTFVDNHSQRNFSKWYQSSCVVFYGRMIEYPWESPVADALYEKLRRKGWQGQCFILKGHYKEFSVSFDKYISGTKMTQQAKDYADSLRHQSSPTPEQARKKYEQYEEWLKLFESEDRATPAELTPPKRVERVRAVEQHQRELEAEFEARFPALCRKARTLHAPVPPAQMPMASGYGRGGGKMPTEPGWKDTDSFDLKAPLVPHLQRGLDKMREMAGFSTTAEPPSRSGYHGESYTDKLGEKVERHSDDFDEIDPKGEGLKNDPAFQLAGASGTKLHDGGGDVPEDHRKRGRRPLWGRLRSSGNK